MSEGIAEPGRVTRLLLDSSEGDERARDEMLPLVVRRVAPIGRLAVCSSSGAAIHAGDRV